MKDNVVMLLCGCHFGQLVLIIEEDNGNTGGLTKTILMDPEPGLPYQEFFGGYEYYFSEKEFERIGEL